MTVVEVKTENLYARAGQVGGRDHAPDGSAALDTTGIRAIEVAASVIASARPH